MAIDPIQGLIDYVQEVKPYHTKILEVAVAYAQNETVGVGGEGTTLESEVAIDENVVFSITLFFPGEALTSGSPGIPTRDCGEGWGSEWDRPTPYIVVNANISPQTISLDGSYADDFAIGQCIEVREPYEDATLFEGSPCGDNTPRKATMLITSVGYDSDTDTTILGVTVKSEEFIGSPVCYTGSPSVFPVATTTFFPILTDQVKWANHNFSNLQTLIITGEDYASRTGISIGAYGSPISSDYVIVPPPTDSFDKTSMFVLPTRTNSSGSPAIADVGPYKDGKYYIEFEILDLEAPSNSGWGPYFGFGRAERTRADNRYTARPNETVVLDTYVGTDIQHGSGLTDPNGGSNRSIGDVYSMAIDYERSKVWFRQNGTWLGSGVQDPSAGSPSGGFWPGDFTTNSISGSDVNAHMIPMMWLFNQGTTSTGSPFNKPSTQDKIGIRLASDYWDYAPPTGFTEWPDITSEPNVYGPGEQQWYRRDDTTVGASSGLKTHLSSFGDSAIATLAFPISGNARTAYYGLERSAGQGGKFYFEWTTFAAAGGARFGLYDTASSAFGSPIFPLDGSGSPFNIGPTIYVDDSGNLSNTNGLPSGSNDPTTIYRTGGYVLASGNPSRDGRTSGTGASGDTMMVAIDFDQNRFWAGVNGVWSWDIDPATVGSPQAGFILYNVGGSPNLSAATRSYILGVRGSGNGPAGILNLGGQVFNYRPPTGFEPWAYAGPGASFGSPFTVPNGSPPFSGSEFWFPPYPPGAFSNGDVYQIYDVVETKELKIVRRPNVFYGSPGVAPTGSPYTPIWPYFFGSPVGSPFNQGSPKTVPGSPLQYPTLGSPNVADNTIVIKSTTPDLFVYGKEFEIRNATETTLNKTYNVYSATDLGGSPNLVELTVLDTVLANTTNDGELVFTENGWSGGDYCDDVPDQWLQNHILEQVDFDWRFKSGSPDTTGLLVSGFQHWILSANSTNNTINVQGDARYLISEFSGSPVSPGSPSITASIQHSVTGFGSPYDTALNTNNGSVTIQGVTYDITTNESTLQLNTVSESTPSGWIIGRGSLPAPPAPPAGAYVLVFSDAASEGSLTLGVQYTSDDDITTWTPITPPIGGSPQSGDADVGFPSPCGLRYAEDIDTWALAYKRGSGTSLWYSTDDGVSWQFATESITVATNANDKVLDWSPDLGLFAVGGNSGQIATSPDGIIWTNQNPGIFGTSQVVCVHWSAGLQLFVASTTNNEVGYSANGSSWTLAANEPGGAGFDDLVGIYSIGTRVFVANDNDEDVYYTDTLTTTATWTQSTIPQAPISGAGTFASNADGSILVWAGQGFNDGEYIWRSTDTGVNFTRVEIASQLGFSDVDTFCVAYDPDYGFMVGGEFRVGSPRVPYLATSDDALTWTVRVNDKFEHPGGDGRLSNEISLIGSKNQVTTVA